MASHCMSIDIGEGSYGKTIRMYTMDEGDIRALLEMFRKLAAGGAGGEAGEGAGRFNLMTLQEDAVSSNLRDLTAEVIAGEAEPGFCFGPIRTAKAGHWVWRGRPEDWGQCEELMQAMLDYKKPCHQYLTEMDTEAVLVEVSFRE